MTDPKRLGELGSEAPDALRALLQSGRDDLPGPEQMDRLAMRLGPLLGGPALPAPEPPPVEPTAAAAGSAGAGALAKLVGAGTAIVVLAGGGWLLTRSPPAPAPAPPPPVTVSEPAPRVKPAAPAPASEPQPLENRPAEEPAPSAPRTVASARPTASGPSESALLAQAQGALATNPERALALTREHKRRFPNGALVREREVIAIEALKRSGDSEAARKRGQAFEEKFPGSAHRRKVENATKP
jgi:hypothetical protein